jgi:AraC family transcriptional regulator
MDHMKAEMSVLLDFRGVRVRRVLDPSRAVVAEHAHDWPMISLYVMGGYRNVTDCGEREIAGPSMVFYRPGAGHRNVAGETGFEQIEIEFDPAWLGASALPPQAVLTRVGGTCGALARSVAVQCDAGFSEAELRNSIRRLLSLARLEPARPIDTWINSVTTRLRADPGRRIAELAREVGRSPAWIGPAYRSLIGEGLQEVAARFRVERAARLLRESEQPLCAIAIEAGFCDQSHMNRTFRRVLGRLPTAVRRDRQFFRREVDGGEAPSRPRAVVGRAAA